MTRESFGNRKQPFMPAPRPPFLSVMRSGSSIRRLPLQSISKVYSIPLSLRSKRAFPATALEWKCALRIEMRDHERQTAYSLPPSLSKPEYFKDDAPMTDTGKGGRGEGAKGRGEEGRKTVFALARLASAGSSLKWSRCSATPGFLPGRASLFFWGRHYNFTFIV